MNEAATEFFRANGYGIFRDVIPLDRIAVVKGFLEQQEALADAALKKLGIRTNASEIGSGINRILTDNEDGEVDRNARLLLTGHFPLEARLSEVLWEIPKNDRVRRLLGSILQSDTLAMHMPPTARLIFPGNDVAAVPAHQDLSYNQHMTDFITMWVPLVEIDETCGGVAVFEGHTREHLPTTLQKDGVWNAGLKTAGSRRVECVPMHPGDVLIFNKYLIHESMPNNSNRTRLSVDYRFFGGSDTSKKHHLDMQSWKVIPPAAEQ